MADNKAAILIARQIAIFNHHIWEKIPEKRRTEYLTLAKNIIATAERVRD